MGLNQFMASTTQIQPKIMARGSMTLREGGGIMADTKPIPQHQEMLRQHKGALPAPAKNADAGPIHPQHQGMQKQMGDACKP